MCGSLLRGLFIIIIIINYQDFSYNGSKITFSFSEQCVMVNATKMAKVFGKVPGKWLELPSTKEFLTSLSNICKLDISRLVITKQESSVNGGGTWFHKDVAIEFARWLAPAFAIWCNDKILELLTTGKTEIRPDEKIPLLTPEQEEKIRFAEAQIESDVPCSFRGVANRIMLTNGKKMTRSQFMSWLYQNNYLQKSDNVRNCPTQSAIDMGFFMIKVGSKQIRKDRVPRNRGDKGMVTPKGAMHLINVLFHSLPAVTEV